MVVLGIAEPHVSRKYELTMCVAGMTSHGDFRRIYSVPMKHYYNHPFKKYQYIRYEVIGKGGDGRPESRKVDMSTLEPLDFASQSTVSAMIRDNASSSLEYLRDREKRSLGIIRPERIANCIADNNDQARTGRYKTPQGSRLEMNLLPFWVWIDFACRPRCGGHRIMCEDMELGNYYRRGFDYKTRSEGLRDAEEKVMAHIDDSNAFFLVGTHVRWKNWLIISIINQQAEHLYSLNHLSN